MAFVFSPFYVDKTKYHTILSKRFLTGVEAGDFYFKMLASGESHLNGGRQGYVCGEKSNLQFQALTTGINPILR